MGLGVQWFQALSCWGSWKMSISQIYWGSCACILRSWHKFEVGTTRLRAHLLKFCITGGGWKYLFQSFPSRLKEIIMRCLFSHLMKSPFLFFLLVLCFPRAHCGNTVNQLWTLSYPSKPIIIVETAYTVFRLPH